MLMRRESRCLRSVPPDRDVARGALVGFLRQSVAAASSMRRGQLAGSLELLDLLAHLAPRPAQETRGFRDRLFQPDAVGELEQGLSDHGLPELRFGRSSISLSFIAVPLRQVPRLVNTDRPAPVSRTDLADAGQRSHVRRMHLDLSDEETAALLRELGRRGNRDPLSPRILNLKTIRARSPLTLLDAIVDASLRSGGCICEGQTYYS